MTRHILLIESEKQEKSFFDNALQRLHSDVFLMYAENQPGAIKILEQFRPDIVFIGAELPGKGLLLLKKIRTLKNCSQLPVYMYTSEMDATTGMRALLSGAAGCLLRTESLEYLTNSLHEIIRTEIN
jgi:DNA-binding response OmpR family regulator